VRVLVTGFEGYIGPIMADELERRGHEIVGLDTGYFAECSMGAIPRRLNAIKKDVRDLRPADLAGFDAIVHLAALSNDPMGELRPEWTYQINLEGSLNLARVARDAGVQRFLFSSSCSLYGASEHEMAVETSPVQPLSAYAISKVKTEEGLERLADTGFSPVFLRNSTAYGASPRMRLDLVLNNLAAWAFTTGKVQIMSDGTPWRPLVHIEDIARAFGAVLEAPRDVVHNQAFNVGADTENYQVRDVAEFVRQAVPGSVIRYSGQNSPDPRNYRVSFAKIRTQVPGFQPVWNAEKGVAQVLAAYQHAGLKPEDLESRNYIRLKQLRYLLDSNELDEALRWKETVAA